MELETMLRQCYEEVEIRGFNKAKYDQRVSIIQKISEESLLTKEDYTILTDYILQIDNEKTEELINDLEGYFCENDDSFTKENKKEINVLIEVLVYQYLVENNDLKIALSIVSGNSIGNRMKSQLIYENIEEYLKKQRHECRRSGNIRLEPKRSEIQTVVSAVKKTKQEEGVENFEYDTTTLDGLLSAVEINDKNLSQAFQVMSELVGRIETLSEESDILWWLTNAWSDLKDCPFSKLKQEEGVVLLPYELWNKVQYTLTPVSARALLTKAISYAEEMTDKITLEMAVDAVDAHVFDKLELDVVEISKLQPVLMALALKAEYFSEESPQLWKEIFVKRYGKKTRDIEFRAKDFAYHVLLELELWNANKNEE